MPKNTHTRERLIDEATRLINTQGFGATSINDLLAASGSTKGSLYHYFPGKDGLGLAVLEQAQSDFVAFLENALTGATPGEQLTGFLTAALAKHRDVGFVGGCIFGNTALEMADSDTAYARVVQDVFDRWIARLRTVIEAAQQVGQVRVDLSADQLAGHVVSALEGGIMLSRLRKEEGPLASCVECLVVFLRPPGPVVPGESCA